MFSSLLVLLLLEVRECDNSHAHLKNLLASKHLRADFHRFALFGLLDGSEDLLLEKLFDSCDSLLEATQAHLGTERVFLQHRHYRVEERVCSDEVMP